MIYRERFHLAVPCSRFRLLADGTDATLPLVEFGILRVAYAELPLSLFGYKRLAVFLTICFLPIPKFYDPVRIFLHAIIRTLLDFPDLFGVGTAICCRAFPVLQFAKFI